MVFTDEKSFQIEQFVHKQNDQVYLPKRSVENLHQELKRAAVTVDDRPPLIFINRGVNINAEYYRENVLKAVLKPWADKHFSRRPWTFQQDSAPPQSARVNQEWPKN